MTHDNPRYVKERNVSSILADKRVRRARITAMRKLMETDAPLDLQAIVEQAQAEAVTVALTRSREAS